MAGASATISTTTEPSFAALTTTFTPPAPCATQFMQLAIDEDRIWMNPLRPAIGLTATSCYASEWLESSSIAAFSPLLCPSGYQTQTTFASPRGYAACCPLGFDGLSLAADAPGERPARSATCYSDIFNSGIYITQYDSTTAVTTTAFTVTESGAQIYAHVYDGFVSGANPTASTPSSSSSSASASASPAPSSDSGLSTGAIAGIAVGAILGLILLLALLLVALRRRRRRKLDRVPIHEVHGESAVPAGGIFGTRGDFKEKKGRRVSELSAVRKPSELSAVGVPLWELQGTPVRERGSPEEALAMLAGEEERGRERHAETRGEASVR